MKRVCKDLAIFGPKKMGVEKNGIFVKNFHLVYICSYVRIHLKQYRSSYVSFYLFFRRD
jgi:hypothetical protein